MTRGSNLNGYLENSLESEETMLHNRGGVINDRERDLNMYRSGSAPPTMEGSLNALGSIFGNLNFAQIDSSNSTANGVLTEEEIQSHPVYLSYYYSHHNINPRLPPPLFSKEDWRVGQRFQAGGSSFGGSGDWRKKNFVDDGGSSSLFSMQPAEDELMELRKDILRNLSRKNSVELLDRGSDGFIGTSVPGMGVRRKGFADILQKGLNQPDSQSDCLPASHNAFHDIGDTAGISKSQSAHIRNGAESTGALHDGGGHPGLSRVQNLKSAVSNSFASALGSSLSRSGTPDPHLSWRSPSPNLLPVGSRVFPVEKNNFVGMKAVKGLSSSMTELVDVAASLSNLSLEKNRLHDEDNLIQSQLQRGFDKQSNHVSDTSNGHRNSLQQQFIDKSRVENWLSLPTVLV